MIDNTINSSIEEKQEPVTTPETTPTNIDLGFVEKRVFCINGDLNRVLSLNVSDLNIASRLNTGYPKLKELLTEAQEKLSNLSDGLDDEKTLAELANTLTDIDAKMRETIDFIFDTNASAVCAPSGNMYDPVGGQFRFERIIDVLAKHYTNGLDAEFAAVKKRVENKASKYTKKGKK